MGAKVVFEGTALGASIDFHGKYQFRVDAGVNNLMISYVGYSDKEIEGVEVKNNELIYLDAMLGSDAMDLDVRCHNSRKGHRKIRKRSLIIAEKIYLNY